MQDLIELDESEVQEHFFEAGWTDGLPIVPPTPDRVVSMMLAGGVTDPDEIIGTVPQRQVSVTVEQLAINAVMAGCTPAYFPVVMTAAECLLDPTFNAHTACTSTGGAALCVVVSGPMAAELGMNGGLNALGSGNRANATIGRSVRLLAANVLGARSGALDGSSMGHPGKYTFCFAEEPSDGFEPHRVAMGYDEVDTTVTVMPSEGPHQVANHMNGDPEGILRTFAAAMSVPATFSVGKRGQGIVVLGWEHRKILLDAGWTRADIQAFLAEHTRVTPDQLAAAGIPLEGGQAHPQVPDADGRLASFRSPEDIFVVTAGGAGAGWSAYIPSWAPPLHAHAEAVTRRVRPPGEALPDCGPDGCEVPQP